MSTRLTNTFLKLILGGASLLVLFILGLWGYVSITATPLHPDPAAVPSTMRSTPPPQWGDPIEQSRQAVRAALAAQNLPGLSVAVGLGNDLVWAEGFGWANIDDRDLVTPDTMFRLGTASTLLTSAAVGLLLEEGRLKLDEPVQTYVSAFPPWPATLRQVMGHMSGIRSDGGDDAPLFGKQCERPADAFQHLSGYAIEPLSEPGVEFHYSSYNWIVVSAAVEAATGEPLLSFMRKRVLRPLGMSATDSDSVEPAPNRPTFYFPRFAADPRYGYQLMDGNLGYTCYSGASMFLSTPSDLVRFAMALGNGALLKPETVQLLQTSQKLTSGQDSGYGLGWEVESVALAGVPTRRVGETGTSVGGPLATLIMFPDRKLVIAVMSNTSYSDTAAVAMRLAEAFSARR